MRLLSFLFLYLFTSTLNAQTPVFTASQEATTAGSEVTVAIRVDSLENAVSIQYSLSWDSDVLTYQSTGDYGLPGSSAFNFGETQIDQGILTFVWFDGQVNGLTLPDGSTIFSVTFNAIGQAGEQSAIAFVNSPTPIQVGVVDGTNISEVPGTYLDGLVQIITNNINLQDSITPIPCFGATTGSIDITLEGGLSPYEYNWTGPNDFTSNESNLVDLPAGEYSVTVNDQLGNTNSATYTINQATPIQVNGVTITPTDCDQFTGSITLSTSGGTPDYSYDFGDGFISEATQTNLAAGSYTVLIQDAANCQTDTLITIGEASKPSVSLGQDRSICPGDDFALSAGTDNDPTYEWLQDDLPLTNTLSSLTITAGGIYEVRVTNESGCTGRDTINVTEETVPTINLGQDTFFCMNDNLLLNATTGLSYEWFFNGNALRETSPTLTVTEAGTYSLIGTNAATCSGSDTIVVSQIPLPMLTTSPDTSLCMGSSVLLMAESGSENTEWFLNGEVLTETGSQLSTSQTGTYRVVVSNQAGCSNSAEIILTPAQVAQANLGQDAAICLGAETTLNAPAGASSYQWSFNGIPLTATTSALTVQETGLYSVTVTSVDDCIASDTIQVNAAANPTVSLGPDLEICPRTTTSLLADMGLVRYEWFLNNVPFGDNDAEMEVTEPGTYTILVTDTNGCEANDTLLLTQTNVLVVTAGPDTTITEGDSVTLFATGGGTYQWAADLELSCYDCANPIANPFETTTYQVIIRSEEGCESEVFFTVEVMEGSDLLVDLVNFISPNGDGKNDFLFFNGLENYQTSQLSIFNRWGVLLFNKINYQGDGIYWEATYKGQPLPAGVYYYILRLSQVDEVIRSSLTIVRD
jgi:gliding motility-associated-like protein